MELIPRMTSDVYRREGERERVIKKEMQDKLHSILCNVNVDIGPLGMFARLNELAVNDLK